MPTLAIFKILHVDEKKTEDDVDDISTVSLENWLNSNPTVVVLSGLSYY